MSSLELLEFARGPALWFSLAAMIAGSLWRILGCWRLGTQPDLSVPRSTRSAAGALEGIVVHLWPRRQFPLSLKLGTLNGYVYHLGLAIITFGYLPHIEFVRRLTGLHWPALPEWVVYVAVGPTVVSLVIALIERLVDPVRRLLSGFDDYFTWAIVMLPILTGMALISQPASADATLGAASAPLPLAIHLLSVELVCLWLPFGKLSHAFLVFFSRGLTAAALARKGAAI